MSKLPLTSYSMPSPTWNLAPSYLSSVLSVFFCPKNTEMLHSSQDTVFPHPHVFLRLLLWSVSSL